VSGAAAISVRDVRFAYGNVPVLFGVDLDVRRGEVLGVLGPNGAGKTTLLRVVSGLESPEAGSIVLDGEDVTGMPAARRVERGLVTVFAGRSTFPDLTVTENLRVTGHTLRSRPGLLDERITEVLELFPRLAERRSSTASQLSGAGGGPGVPPAPCRPLHRRALARLGAGAGRPVGRRGTGLS
jgi:branched-chain amino acid transport system ATP-binding protein